MHEDYDRSLRPETLMMGYGYHPEWSEGALKSPIYQTSTFVFRSAAEGKRFFALANGLADPDPGEQPGLIYSRLNNPDLEILEDRLTVWDDADAALVFSSGMAAIATTLLAHLRPGDVLLHSSPLYGGTDHVIRDILPEFGVTPVEFIASDPIADVEAALDAVGADLRMILIETPANPTNDLFDIEALARLAQRRAVGERRPLVAVDNTFLGPMWQHPLAHGADLVLYSATKYIGGHSDLIAGACVGTADAVAPVAAMRTYLGTMAAPLTGWLLMRSLETLHLRMERQTQNARRVADFLASHPKVKRVRYLGLLEPNDPDYEIYKRQCLGPGAMVSFDVDGAEDEAFRFLDALQHIKLAVSLGGTESLAEHPATMTHAGVCDAAKQRSGVTASLVRLSIGVEHPDDLVVDFGQALDSL